MQATKDHTQAWADVFDAARRLLDLLHQENDALARQDAASIERLAAAKVDALGGLQASRAEELLGAHPDAPAAGQLRDLLTQINAANETNGIYIAHRMRTVERELAIIHGAVDAGQPAGLYGRDGSRREEGRSRQITRA